MYRSIRRGVVNHFGFVGIVAVIALVWSLLLGCQPSTSISSGVLAWWTGLCLVSVFNIWVWRLSATALVQQRADKLSPAYVFQRRQLVLCAFYVLGCAFRAILPRADVQRLGLVDSWVSSVMVGRTVATVAELCFAAQWALLLYEVGKNARRRFATTVSWLVVPLIAIAEIFSWYSVLTTAYIGNAIEESIWALTATLIILGFLTIGSRYPAGSRPLKAAVLACGLCYVAFMCAVDIPMYLSAAAGRPGKWPELPFDWPGIRRCAIAPNRHVCLGPVASRDSLDVSLFHSGSLVQPRGARLPWLAISQGHSWSLANKQPTPHPSH